METLKSSAQSTECSKIGIARCIRSGGYLHQADDDSSGFKGSLLAYDPAVLAVTIVDKVARATDAEQGAKHNLVVAL